jgi:hypothetical protein
VATLPTYPTISGARHSFASIELKVAGQIFSGFKSINYSRVRSRSYVMSNNPDPIGKTRGTNAYKADVEFYLAEFNAFMSMLGGQGIQLSGALSIPGVVSIAGALTINAGGAGYGDQAFQILVTYSENGFDTITDQLIGCTFDSTEASNSVGDDPTVRKVELNPIAILYGGISDNATPLVQPQT